MIFRTSKYLWRHGKHCKKVKFLWILQYFKIQFYVTWKDIESFRYIIFRVFKFIYCLNGFPCHISDTQSDHPSHISSTPLTQNTMLDDSCLDQLLYDFGFFFWPTRYLPLREGRKGEIEGRKGMAFDAAADFSSLW